ncbi:hypothetical protein FOA52_000691 [Chlamydomonas sp. UWO 241]|nr:hypothetical protein FOA52_000691 [Chlamydomonas sp. UWO 241]
MPLNTGPGEFDPEHDPWVERVGERPQVYYFHNFLTDAERQHMIKVAAPQMRRSTVVGPNGESVVDPIRTSFGMFINRRHDPIIERIERRISLFTHLPISHQEDIQVLRYTAGQKYGAHYDSSYDKNDKVGPKYRLATFYMYLSDVQEGGETAFPKDSQWSDPAMGAKADPSFSDCAKGNVAAKPKANDAALFYSFFANGTMDDASMHTGCPVVKGIKWGAPVWIHVDEFRPEEMRGAPPHRPEPRDPGACIDHSPNCGVWTKSGECTKNSAFMAETCGASCGSAETCEPRDWDCVNRNREKLHYLKIDREEMRWLGVDLHDALAMEPSPEL